jgi:pimeloyl-ACP methyl ester carboxylesterase
MKRSRKLADGATLSYLVKNSDTKGAKIGLLILPGLLDTKENWAELQQKLSQSVHVCVMDLRGTGDSSNGDIVSPAITPPDITIVQLATDAFEVILDLKWKSFFILGSCFGGMVASQLALLLNGRDDVVLKGLILVNTTPIQPTLGSSIIREISAIIQSHQANKDVTELVAKWLKLAGQNEKSVNAKSINWGTVGTFASNYRPAADVL